MTRRLAPISLRRRSAESIRRARELLLRLDAEEQLQRRARWQATKALIAVSEMISDMPSADRDRWRTECETVKGILKRIKDSLKLVKHDT